MGKLDGRVAVVTGATSGMALDRRTIRQPLLPEQPRHALYRAEGAASDVAFPPTERGRHSVACFRSSMIPPASPLSTLRYHPSRNHRQDSRPEWSRFSFSVGLSHPLQCAGLSRRSLSTKLLKLLASSQLKSQSVTSDLVPSSRVRSVSGYFCVSHAGDAAVAVLSTVYREHQPD